MDELEHRARVLVSRHGLQNAALRLAAAISLAWIVIGAAMASLTVLPKAMEAILGGTSDTLGAIGGLIVIGSAAAAVTYPLVAWRLARWAVDCRSFRGAVVGVSLAEVVANAAAIATGIALLAAVGGGPLGLLLGLFAFIIGLLLFGLPGLAMALASSYVLVRLLRAADETETSGA